MKKTLWIALLALPALALLTAACASGAPPSPTPSAAPNLTSTFTPPPNPTSTATLTPVPSYTPAPTPIATVLPAPAGLRVELYELTGPPQVEPLTFQPLQGTQLDLQLQYGDLTRQNVAGDLEKINLALKPFGLRAEAAVPAGEGVNVTYRLYKDDKLLYDKEIFFLSRPAVLPDGSDFYMNMDTTDGTYLVTRDSVSRWTSGLYTSWQPVALLNGQVLTAEEVYSENPSDPLQAAVAVVRQGGQEILRVPVGRPAVVSTLRGLWSDGTHWAFEVVFSNPDIEKFARGMIFLDGVSVNEQYGYSESFNYMLLNGQPLFLYEKDGQIGVRYAGQEIPLGLDSVPHYQCCNAGALNPRVYDRLLEFFGQRGEKWYWIAIRGE